MTKINLELIISIISKHIKVAKKDINIKFIKANAENIPFESNFFDKYLISFCLRNITSIDLALKEAIRVLKQEVNFIAWNFLLLLLM